MATGKQHRSVAAEGNCVLLFFLALSGFGLEILGLLPTMLFQIFLSVRSTMKKVVTDPYLLYHNLKGSNKNKITTELKE